MAHLIQIRGDVFVASEVAAIIMVEEDLTLSIILKGNPDLDSAIEYDFDSSKSPAEKLADLKTTALAAIKVLQALDCEHHQ